ncbi:MAG: FCD domain-containing protein [Planctomycetes bacterium]|nr:FCD domain-containing protein [Planctomycetota bacterium]
MLLAAGIEETPAGGREQILADIAFHRALAVLTDCPVLLWNFDRLVRQGFLLLRRANLPFRQRNSHFEFIEQLRDEDPDCAEKSMREHIHSGKSAMALERGLYINEERPRFGPSPLLAQQRMGRSMQNLLLSQAKQR